MSSNISYDLSLDYDVQFKDKYKYNNIQFKFWVKQKKFIWN